MNTLDYDTIQKKKGGTISKKKFTKNLLAFYEDGGENPNDPNAIGKGNRQDNAAREVGKIVPSFVGNLKKGSNKATTGEIYELAKGDPEIMQTLMTNGKQENLAEPTESNPNEMEYAQEGRELQNNGNQMEEIIGQVQGALESGAQPEEPQGQPQSMGPSEEEMMAMQQQQQQMGPPPMMEPGGFVDMDAENPLTRFISGGMESEYYDPYDMPQAHEGHQVQQCPQGQAWSEEHGRCITSTYKNINYTQGPPRSTGLFPRLGRSNKFAQMSNFMGNTAGPVSRVDFKNNWLGRPKKGTVYFGEGNFGENSNTSGGNNGGGNNGGVYENITNAFGNVASNIGNRKNNKYEKYLGEGNFGEDYWEDFRDGAREGFRPNSSAFSTGEYAYNADSMRDMVAGKRSHNQLNKLYKSEDKQRFQDARQTARQTNRAKRRDDRTAAKIIKNQEYGGYIPAYRNGGVSGPGGYMDPMGPNGGITPFTQTYIDDYNSGNSGFLDENNNGISDYIERPDNQPGSADFKMRNFNQNYEQDLNVFNNYIAKPFINAFENAGSGAKGKNKAITDTSVEKTNASTANYFEGNWGLTTGQGLGMFRYPDEGQDNNGMASTMAKYGRYMEDGGYIGQYENGGEKRCPEGLYWSQIKNACVIKEELKDIYHDMAYTDRNDAKGVYKYHPAKLEEGYDGSGNEGGATFRRTVRHPNITHNSRMQKAYRDYIKSNPGFMEEMGEGMYHVGSQAVGTLKSMFGLNEEEDGGYMQDENVPPGYHMMPNGMIMPDNQMKQGGTNSPYYDEGQVVFMTQDQLNNHLASGGQVEYLY